MKVTRQTFLTLLEQQHDRITREHADFLKVLVASTELTQDQKLTTAYLYGLSQSAEVKL